MGSTACRKLCAQHRKPEHDVPSKIDVAARLIVNSDFPMLRTRLEASRATRVLEFGGTLVTRNIRDFALVPGWVIEDWSIAAPTE